MSLTVLDLSRQFDSQFLIFLLLKCCSVTVDNIVTFEFKLLYKACVVLVISEDSMRWEPLNTNFEMLWLWNECVNKS